MADTRHRRWPWLSALLAVAMLAPGVAAEPAPKVPPGSPTSGSMIALITAGIDYTQPGVAGRLARDGEGDVIGHTPTAPPVRPYLRNAPDTGLLALTPHLVVPVQVDVSDLAQWRAALDFIAASPARLVVVATRPDDPALSRAVLAAFASQPRLLFLLPARRDDEGPRPANVLAVAALPQQPGDPLPRAAVADLVLGPVAATREAPGAADAPPRDARSAAVMATALTACHDLRQPRSPAEFKQRLIARAAVGPPGSAPLLATCH
jgi:hypothetical protein